MVGDAISIMEEQKNERNIYISANNFIYNCVGDINFSNRVYGW